MYPTAMLLNKKKGTYHPISFRVAPLPGGHELPSAARYKSAGHHDAGFATEAEALAWIKAQGAKCVLIDALYEWDGESVPAMVEFFPHSLLAGKS